MDISEFDYHAEQAKLQFQADISSLLELQAAFETKRLESLRNKKNGAFLTNTELKVFGDWILRVTSDSMAAYLILDGTNRKLQKLNRCAFKIANRQPETPSLKGLTE